MNSDRWAHSESPLPIVLKKKHGIIQGNLWAATEELDSLLKASQGSKGWRNHPKFFCQNPRASLNFGAVNFSPAWFEMGHEVSSSTCKIFYPLTAYFKRGDDAKVPAGGQDLRF